MTLPSRIPPQDLGAEGAILGAVLLEGRRALDLLAGAGLRTEDFYTEAHRILWRGMGALYQQEQPVDVLTLTHWLKEHGEYEAVGGAPTLAGLYEQAAIPAHLDAYAQIVVEHGQRREVIQAGTQLVTKGYDGGTDARELIGDASRRLEDLTRRSVGQPYDPALNWRQVVESWQQGVVRVGLGPLDAMTGGLARGDLLVVAGRTSRGKALALDTPLPTPTGWTTMGDVHGGDYLLGSDGQPTRITFATDIMAGRPCFEVLFSDGAKIVADADHQWMTLTRLQRRSGRMPGQTVTTREIAETLMHRQYRNHAIPVCAPLQLPTAALPIPPYALGAWLGDGDRRCARITSTSPEIIAEIQQEGMPVHRVAGGRNRSPQWWLGTGDRRQAARRVSPQAQLRAMGLLGNKHIPPMYLRASEAQRRALLAGLLDTDGTVTDTGSISFDVTSRALAETTRELVLTLGFRVTMRSRRVAGATPASSICYRLRFTTDEKVFRLPRKHLAQVMRRAGTTTKHRADRRTIAAVRPVPSVPVRCIQVDAADGLYLAGANLIPTHNTALACDRLLAMAQEGRRVEILTLEETQDAMTRRFVANLAGVSMYRLRDGSCSPGEFLAAEDAVRALQELPVTVRGAQSLRTLDEAAIVGAVALSSAEVVVIDHVQKVQVRTQKGENYTYALRRLVDRLHALAQRDRRVVWLNAQLSRETDDRKGPPLLSDIMDSSSLENAARQVWLLHWPWKQAPDKHEPSEYLIYVAKNSEGGTGKVTLRFQAACGRFEEAEP